MSAPLACAAVDTDVDADAKVNEVVGGAAAIGGSVMVREGLTGDRGLVGPSVIACARTVPEVDMEGGTDVVVDGIVALDTGVVDGDAAGCFGLTGEADAGADAA